MERGLRSRQRGGGGGGMRSLGQFILRKKKKTENAWK